MGGGVEGKVVGWAATDRLLDGSLVVLVHSKRARWYTWWGGGLSQQGGREGDRDDVGRMVGPSNHHPNTPHTPKGAGPPGAPSQVEVSKGRSRCVVASSVPCALAEEGPGHGTGWRDVPVARPGSTPHVHV